MSIRNKNDIRVYSELPFQINLVGQHREYSFPPCVDGNPIMNYVDWADIEYAHSRGNLFSAGLLIFSEDEQEEIYRELGMRNWKDTVWFDKDIVDAIENPTLAKMQRIIDVKDALTFERIRGKVVMYTNRGLDISQKVVNIVNQRYKELNVGIRASKIVIRPVDVETTASAEEVAHLKEQLESMRKLVEKMAAQKNNNTASGTVKVNSPVEEKDAEPVVVKKSGRKISTKK